MSQSEKGAPRLMGTVTSNKMDKTITVLVEHREKHALYGKYISRSRTWPIRNIAADWRTTSSSCSVEPSGTAMVS